MMKLKIAQVIGLNTDQKAAQVVSSLRDDNAFLGVLELVSDDAFTKGRQILSELEDFYFEFEGSYAERLKATFDEAKKKVADGVDFSLTLAAISGKVLYLIGKGQIEVYLKRGDKLSSLLSVGSQEQLISGFIVPKDRLLLSTTSLSTFLGADLIKSVSLPIDNFEEEVESRIDESIKNSDAFRQPTESNEGIADDEPKNESLPPAQGLAALVIEVLEEEAEIASLPLPDEQDNLTRVEEEVKAEAAILPLIILTKLKAAIGRLPVYLPQSGRGRAILAIAIIVIILLGALYQYKLSLDRKIQTQFSQMLQEARDDFNSAKGLASLNPADAKVKLDLSVGKINKALLLKPNNQEAQGFKKQIDQESASILQQSSVVDFPVFLDIDLVKKNFRASKMSLSGTKLLLLDPGVKTLVMVDLIKKSNQILAGSDQLGDASSLSLNGAMAFVYSKDKGVLKIDTTNQKLTTVAKKDNDLGDIKDIYGFAGNIYLLDSGKNKIWKYLPTSDSYSDKREYLSKDTKVDLSSALRMQIESSIYVLKNGGEILRFTKGDKDNFSLSGLDKGVKDPKSLFISSDTDNLYLLDSGNSRLLILTKTGVYKGQMSGNKFAQATDLAVDEIGKKVYLLDGGKIYTADLK